MSEQRPKIASVHWTDDYTAVATFEGVTRLQCNFPMLDSVRRVSVRGVSVAVETVAPLDAATVHAILGCVSEWK